MNKEIDIKIIYDHFGIERAEPLKLIVAAAERSPTLLKWDCREKGYLYDVRFFYKDDERSFRYAIVPAKQWLLWYFRKPALEKFSYDIPKLKTDFEFPHKNGKVNVNKKGEITVKLFTCSDARKLIDQYLK